MGRYVPGSVLKIVTAIAGLDSGAITPQTTFPEQPAAETAGLVVDGFKITDGHHPSTDGTALDLKGATEVSCNIWYALAGLRIGGARLVSEASQLGFGAPIPFDLPTAASSLTSGQGGDPGGFSGRPELAAASFGQGQAFVTPLQMALVASAVANDGVLMKPHLVMALTGKGAKVPGVLTAGKSGTAEIGGSGEPHSWFIGFAGVDQPRIAIAVIVEQGGRGGARAAPLAGALMAKFFSLYPQP